MSGTPYPFILQTPEFDKIMNPEIFRLSSKCMKISKNVKTSVSPFLIQILKFCSSKSAEVFPYRTLGMKLDL